MDIREYVLARLEERLKKVRISRKVYRKRHLKYKRQRRRILMKAKLRRRKFGYKKWKRKYKIRSHRPSYVHVKQRKRKKSKLVEWNTHGGIIAANLPLPHDFLLFTVCPGNIKNYLPDSTDFLANSFFGQTPKS